MAIKMAEPIGNGAFAPLFVRLSIGGYFLIAGLLKLDHLESFVRQVKSFGVLPSAAAQAYGSLLPYLEILVGVLLIVGFWTTFAAALATLLLGSFIYALGMFPFKGGVASHVFNKDLILLAASISLLYSGAGALSIDRFRKSG